MYRAQEGNLPHAYRQPFRESIMKREPRTKNTSPPPAPSTPAVADALAGYALPSMSPVVERILISAFVVFVLFTTLEAPLRYAFSLVGAVWIIYLRDVAILAAMLALACQQFWRHQLQAAFVVFAAVVVFHGVVSFLQCGAIVAVFMGMKTLLPLMFGAIFLPIFLRGKRFISLFLFGMLLISAVGIVADYKGYPMPWKGMNATVGDYTVVVNKKWNFQGEDRIGGFARDSIVASTILAFIGTYVLLFSRSILFRAVISAATLGLIYLTTSKGGLLAFLLTIIACLLPMKRSQLLNKVLLACAFAAMVLLPIVLPNYSMPPSPSILLSFYDRVERVWPSSWHNIDSHSWIFGSGMGNIGVGQQFLRFEDVDPADNLFLLAYGYFGIFSLVYLGLPFFAALRRKSPVDALGRYAIINLIYIFSYGIVINAIEGSIVAFMMGSAFQALALQKTVPAKEFNRRRYRQVAAARARNTAVLAVLGIAFSCFTRPAAAAQNRDALLPFPADAGALNVKDFGAIGDGVHDDTGAFVSALAHDSDRAEHWHVRIVQVPAGTYRISNTITKRFPDGTYNAGFVLIGAGQSSTILKLDERASGFQDPAHPKAVIYTSGKGVAQAPKNGYQLRGEGDDAFSNFIENLTVDVGSQNPGAIGIDYLSSNQGALRSVTVTGAGRIGIALNRAWFGPGLIDTVTVRGFDIGVDVASLNYGVTVDGLTLIGQRQIGLRNVDNLVAAHGLTIQTLGNRTEVPLANMSAPGMIVVDGGTIEGPGGTAITNQGTASLRGLKVTGFSGILGDAAQSGGVIDGVFQGNLRLSDASPPWALKGAPEPPPADEPNKKWVGVANRQDQQAGVTGADATAALKAALASGVHTIYLPFGVYEIRGNIDIPPTVQRIVGMNSMIHWVPSGADRAADDPAKGLLRTHNTAGPLLIEQLYFSCPAGRHVAIEDEGSAPLVLRDIVGMGTLFQRNPEGGPLFLSDISGGFLMHVAGRSPVWGRQIDTEGGGARGGTGSVRITNDGAPMWLLGLKSEGDNTLVASTGGAVTDVVGVLFASLRAASQPLFTTVDSRLVAAGVEVAWKPGASYHTILVDTQNGRETTVNADTFPPRPQTQGILVPRVITQN